MNRSDRRHIGAGLIRGFEHALGSAPVASLGSVASGRRLRVLAYHDVPDEPNFSSQLEWLARHFNPVTFDEVAAAARAGGALPRRSVWITFDDGHPSVVELAQPVLDRLGISATLFVCPGLVDSHEPFWWRVIESAAGLGVSLRVHGSEVDGTGCMALLKRVPDDERRAIVAQVGALIERRTGQRVAERQLTTDELRGWIAGGNSVGSHTWDHPSLRMCTREEQATQISRAEDWLRRRLSMDAMPFAYPNGDWTECAETILRQNLCPLAVLFDHRLSNNPLRNQLRVSRLRTSADASLPRFRSLLSGAHSGLFHVRERVRRRAQR